MLSSRQYEQMIRLRNKARVLCSRGELHEAHEVVAEIERIIGGGLRRADDFLA